MRNLSHTFGRFFVYNLFFIFTLSNCTPAEEFDVLLTNFELHSPTAIPGKLGERPQFSIGIKDGEIASIIDHSGGQEYPVAKSTLSLNGQHLYPGFIDAHGHLFGYARTLRRSTSLELHPSKSALSASKHTFVFTRMKSGLLGADGTKMTGPSNATPQQMTLPPFLKNTFTSLE